MICHLRSYKTNGIVDGKCNGILDQGKGKLTVYEEGEKDSTMEKGLDVIANMDNVVFSLFIRSRTLRAAIVSGLV